MTGLRLFNALSGRLEAVKTAAPPRVSFLAEAGADPRFAILKNALAYLGLRLEDGSGPPEIFCGFSAPPKGTGLWLKPEPVSGGPVPGILLLKTHYREALAVSPRALEEARGESAYLRETARRLEERFGSAAASPAGVAGYKKRFRDALSKDLDFPEALTSLWDALRPGALSPGSQLAALREARSAFGSALPLE